MLMKLLKTSLFALLLLLPGWGSAFTAPLQVQVESTWGDADPRDIKTVLESVGVAVMPYIGPRKLGAVIVRNHEQNPVSLYERGPHGEYIVMLHVQGRQWAQMSYQFSHEMCHLLSNYDLAPRNASGQQWFEEAMCEAFSLFALERMSVQWHDNPPYPQWAEYAPEFGKYALNYIHAVNRKLPPGMKLPQWYQQYKATLSKDPYAQDRDLDNLVANQLFPIFSADPTQWAALSYLNLGEDSHPKPLADYLGDWYENAPPDLKGTVAKIREILLKPEK